MASHSSIKSSKRKNRQILHKHQQIQEDLSEAAETLERSSKKVKHLFLLTARRDKSFTSFNIKLIIFIGIVALKIFYPALFTQTKWIGPAFNLVFAYILINVIFNILRIILLSVYYARNNHEPGHYDDAVVIINRLSFLINHLIYFIVALHLLGLNILTILTSISIFAAALALIFRDFIANFLNGFVILFSKNLDIRDYVRMGNVEGRIVDMSFSYVKLLTPNGEEVFIPNSLVLSKEFVNLSKVKNKKFTIDFSLPFRFNGQISTFEKELIAKLCKQFPNHLHARDITLHVKNIDFNQIALSVECYTGTYRYELEQEIRKVCAMITLEFITSHDLKLRAQEKYVEKAAEKRAQNAADTESKPL